MSLFLAISQAPPQLIGTVPKSGEGQYVLTASSKEQTLTLSPKESDLLTKSPSLETLKQLLLTAYTEVKELTGHEDRNRITHYLYILDKLAKLML
ncbi:MAG: hypothetical protein QXD02_04000 [Candidatus Parvarchaeum sp.]|nr:hypothetical protein [Candidatus Parvarchaeum tengchongense]